MLSYRRAASLALTWKLASPRTNAALGDLVEVIEFARWLLGLAHLLEHLDRRDSVARIGL